MLEIRKTNAVTGISYLLPKLIGQSQAMRILLLGEPIDATEARRIQLVHEVVEDADFDARANELAGEHRQAADARLGSTQTAGVAAARPPFRRRDGAFAGYPPDARH